MPQVSDINEPSSSLLIYKFQFKSEPRTIITLPSTYLQNTKVPFAKSSLDNRHVTSSFMTQLSDPTPQTFYKTTFHPQPPYLYIIYFYQKYHKR